MNTRMLSAESEYDIQTAGEILRRGGLVAIPTETVYGLAGNGLDPAVSAKIYAVKGRPSDNPLIVHIQALEELAPLVREIPEQAKALAAAFWPGPLTIILPKSPLVPKETTGGLETVAVRMPSHPAARAVIRAAGVPLAAPSANLSGMPSPSAFSHVCDDLSGRIEAIVDGGDCAVGVESTVITLATPIPRVLRPGGISVEQLQAVLGQVEVDPAVLQQPEAGARVSSPGMKYKHYAPKADVVILDAALTDFCTYVSGQEDCAVLCFEEEKDLFACPVVTYGKKTDALSQAHHLFGALHKLDEIGAKKVFARMPGKAGVGLAVYNRLIRAAAFRVLVPEPTVVVGLTGQTGAGKSTVSQQFAAAGCAVIDCDRITKDPGLYTGACLEQLQQAFGADILFADGTLNRRLVAQRAFSTEEKKQQLNAITHPVIMQRLLEEIQAKKQQGYGVILLDAPTLFEAGADRLCRRIISVLADAKVRLHRVMQRDNLCEADVLRRMQAQPDDAFYIQRSDYVLDNTTLVDSSAVQAILSDLKGAKQGASV